MAEETAAADTAETPPDAGAEFATMMSQAAGAAADPAPYGYTRDRKTGEIRPKISPGRGGASHSPSVEELKAAAEDAGGGQAAEPEEDRAPATGRKSRRRRVKDSGVYKPPADQPAPAYREGVIAKGMNKLYARAGKIVKVMDADIGVAIISVTKKESDDDVTVGEAWDELARTNPRVRAFLLKLIAGGAWGQVFMVHAPIFLAIMLKDGIRKRLPFVRLAEAFLSADDDEDDEEARAVRAERAFFGNLQPEDLAQMGGMFQQMMGDMAAGIPRQAGGPRPPSMDEPAE